jgi:hypothetical protein
VPARERCLNLRLTQPTMEMVYIPCSSPRAGPGFVLRPPRAEAGTTIPGLPPEYAVTAAFLLAIVAGSFAAVILGGYEIAHLIAPK